MRTDWSKIITWLSGLGFSSMVWRPAGRRVFKVEHPYLEDSSSMGLHCQNAQELNAYACGVRDGLKLYPKLSDKLRENI